MKDAWYISPVICPLSLGLAPTCYPFWLFFGPLLRPCPGHEPQALESSWKLGYTLHLVLKNHELRVADRRRLLVQHWMTFGGHCFQMLKNSETRSFALENWVRSNQLAFCTVQHVLFVGQHKFTSSYHGRPAWTTPWDIVVVSLRFIHVWIGHLLSQHQPTIWAPSMTIPRFNIGVSRIWESDMLELCTLQYLQETTWSP